MKANKESLKRIADSLERIASHFAPEDFMIDDDQIKQHVAFIWETVPHYALRAVKNFQPLPFDLLQGVDYVASILQENTKQFSRGLSANNALLWGARGMGKSSLVKSIVHHVNLNYDHDHKLRLLEIQREDIPSLPYLLQALLNSQQRYILFCDDLSFDGDDVSYKSLKSVLDGGLAGRPDNVLFYATSNRRHLMPRDMIENERSTAINPSESVQEKVSLSDRFGLWLGFHACSQEIYLQIIKAYLQKASIDEDQEIWQPKALEWATTRGGRSGRVAWQFLLHYAGQKGVKIDFSAE